MLYNVIEVRRGIREQRQFWVGANGLHGGKARFKW
jgi:hypothetical protein